MQVEENIDEIANEYKIWKKNSPFLYDSCLTHALEWPSLTVQIYPDIRQSPEGDYVMQDLLLGTHAEDGENALIIAEAKMPTLSALEHEDIPPELRQSGGFNTAKAQVTITQKIPHDSEVNRARFNPSNPAIISSWSTSCNIYIFDSRIKPTIEDSFHSKYRPQLILKGHSKQGYGLSWNTFHPSLLASTGDDGKVCTFDLNSALPPSSSSSSSSSLSSVSTFGMNTTLYPLVSLMPAKNAAMEDCRWSPHHPSLLASASDSGSSYIWDLREQLPSSSSVSSSTASTMSAPSSPLLGQATFEGIKPTATITHHSAEVNSICFSHFDQNLIVTGSSDHTLKLVDLRNTSEPLYTFEAHTAEVLQCEWSPTEETIIASSGGDRRILLWDISAAGAQPDEQDTDSGTPPELLFIHGGHTARPNDFCFDKTSPYSIASVSEDSILQIWQVAEHIYSEDEYVIDDVEDEKEEEKDQEEKEEKDMADGSAEGEEEEEEDEILDEEDEEDSEDEDEEEEDDEEEEEEEEDEEEEEKTKEKEGAQMG
ncbi:putative WD domain, G-beta repeat protein [Monocercomonoides exilis]|uniref:putative WD domain, G-beta repeat protein n=1 Tax=Monocercomonoides exilis TaxID=2049356 RepID=UPI00355A63A0|nr:putative WD domain, G-beta repeat protein [Monocercomonoides exilis]|eukprot:MONOS_1378.1-p1 / transcript=MONOS_1378.1 / gene=MONOS_1378 / organism=Monocercomonoides_exilis_PA203 / gene_product=WD domain, G-beta repeat protein / transcript_product=WD domain, G-beta repeat protein / location=Mono_scaffold00024:19215-21746(+) / protein_length=538 / sequence_SO=supercontig / SO=protein_coding / is_pseudo=false